MLVSSPPPAEFPFWVFSGHVYRQPEVAAFLLEKQEEADIWVNDWLFALWQAHKGNTVCQDYRHRLVHWNDWRRNVIQPWRQWRKTARTGPKRLYRQLKESELALEWSDQRYLYHHRDALVAANDSPQDPLTCLTRSLQRLTGWSATVASDSASRLWALSASADRSP